MQQFTVTRVANGVKSYQDVDAQTEQDAAQQIARGPITQIGSNDKQTFFQEQDRDAVISVERRDS